MEKCLVALLDGLEENYEIDVKRNILPRKKHKKHFFYLFFSRARSANICSTEFAINWIWMSANISVSNTSTNRWESGWVWLFCFVGHSLYLSLSLCCLAFLMRENGTAAVSLLVLPLLSALSRWRSDWNEHLFIQQQQQRCASRRYCWTDREIHHRTTWTPMKRIRDTPNHSTQAHTHTHTDRHAHMQTDTYEYNMYH